MATEPIEEKAMAALADILSNLSGVRPGGWTYPRVPTVERILPPINAQMGSETLPRLFVVPGRATSLRPLGSGRDKRIYQHRLHVDVNGVAEATDDGVLGDTWRWRLRQDVLETLHLNLTVHGLAQNIEFWERTEEVDAGEIGPKVWFLQPITVWLLTEYSTAA